jgi:DNA-binding response OmpR family regulator
MNRKPKILLIDDDERLLETTRALLEADGYEVAVHDRGFQATAAAMGYQPDLILLDVNMPGLSGESLASLLRGNERTATIPVLFYSSNDEDALRRLARERGAAGYVPKGDSAALRRRVAAALQERAPAT